MRLIIGLFISILFSVICVAQQPLQLQLQQRGEVTVLVENKHLTQIKNLANYSIEPQTVDQSLVYLNKSQYEAFQNLNIPFVPQIAPSLRRTFSMAQSTTEMSNWDSYPSYEVYLEMMTAFAADFPEYCRIDTIGYSVDGRLILAAKVSDNVIVNENKPEFFYTASMHGDELTGYVLMLRLIDYLLNNRIDEQVQRLLNNIEIYINPLSNPDGAYRFDNSTVSGATRSNINGVDLNRNFPDPKGGDHPDNNEWQPENVAMMNYMKAHNFAMSMNLHGGAEVINYPWDTFQRRHSDDEWFQLVCREFADLAHEVDATYLTDLENGITNGYDWYSVEGGRQDYVTYFLHGREVIGEISSVKMPGGDLLPGFWNKTYKSFLAYMENVLDGVTGRITDHNGNPISAKVTVVDHDIDDSYVYSNKEGTYYRFLKAGTYSFEFEAEGYDNILVENVEVDDYNQMVVDVQFKKDVGVATAKVSSVSVFPNPANNQLNILLSDDVFDAKITLINTLGQCVFSKHEMSNGKLQIETEAYKSGVYYLRIENSGHVHVKKVIIQK